ncbi:MAG: hypothetical protein ABSB69_16745 [Solirubrobacteraceae bacterium]
MYSELPEPVITPATAYEHIVADTIEMIGVTERFPDTDSSLLRYLQNSEDLAARSPRFEAEIHGIQIQADGTHLVPCMPAVTARLNGQTSMRVAHVTRASA